MGDFWFNKFELPRDRFDYTHLGNKGKKAKQKQKRLTQEFSIKIHHFIPEQLPCLFSYLL